MYLPFVYLSSCIVLMWENEPTQMGKYNHFHHAFPQQQHHFEPCNYLLSVCCSVLYLCGQTNQHKWVSTIIIIMIVLNNHIILTHVLTYCPFVIMYYIDMGKQTNTNQ